MRRRIKPQTVATVERERERERELYFYMLWKMQSNRQKRGELK